jgi:hypothetical protein
MTAWGDIFTKWRRRGVDPSYAAFMAEQHTQLAYTEVVRQEYADGSAISAGLVSNHPVDTLYLRFERPEEDATTVLLRPDEMATIAWAAGGVLYSVLMKSLCEAALS